MCCARPPARVAEAPSSRGRSVLLRLALGLGLAVAALSAGAVTLTQWWVLGQVESEFRRAVADEAAALEVFKGIQDLALAVAARAGRGGEVAAGFLYLMQGEDGGCPLSGSNALELCPVGNLARWPATVPFAAGLSATRATAGEPAMLLQVVPLRFGQWLLVARDATPLDDLRRAAWQGALLVALGITLGAALVGWLAGRWLHARLAPFDQLVAQVRAGRLEHRMANAGTRDEFDRLAAAVNEMLDRIVELLRVVRHVSEHAAHDLRTPMARMRLVLERAQRNCAEPATRDAIGDAMARLDRLLETFAALLEIANHESRGREGFAPIDLEAVARDVAETMEGEAELAEVTLRLTSHPARLHGQAALLRTMLANLVHNAIKHAPAGSMVEMILAEPGGPLLRVRDQGPGIPVALRERVFDKFFVGEPGSPRAGTGLGLSLVRVIALRHGLAIRLGDAAPGLDVTLDPASG